MTGGLAGDVFVVIDNMKMSCVEISQKIICDEYRSRLEERRRHPFGTQTQCRLRCALSSPCLRSVRNFVVWQPEDTQEDTPAIERVTVVMAAVPPATATFNSQQEEMIMEWFIDQTRGYFKNRLKRYRLLAEVGFQLGLQAASVFTWFRNMQTM